MGEREKIKEEKERERKEKSFYLLSSLIGHIVGCVIVYLAFSQEGIKTIVVYIYYFLL